jgi:hypothetical protein
MDVFKFRNRIISDYHRYVSSFISISQPRLREFVDECFTSGKLWPDPLIQLNPTFKPGKAVDDLVNEGLLHSECSNVIVPHRRHPRPTHEVSNDRQIKWQIRRYSQKWPHNAKIQPFPKANT